MIIARLLAAVILIVSGMSANAQPARAAVWIPVGVATVCTLQPGCDPYDEAAKTAAVGGKLTRIPVPWNLVAAKASRAAWINFSRRAFARPMRKPARAPGRPGPAWRPRPWAASWASPRTPRSWAR